MFLTEEVRGAWLVPDKFVFTRVEGPLLLLSMRQLALPRHDRRVASALRGPLLNLLVLLLLFLLLELQSHVLVDLLTDVLRLLAVEWHYAPTYALIVLLALLHEHAALLP